LYVIPRVNLYFYGFINFVYFIVFIYYSFLETTINCTQYSCNNVDVDGLVWFGLALILILVWVWVWFSFLFDLALILGLVLVGFMIVI